ncbi:hypothetical protein SBOR_9622 [Sclerotinia borealis F-4128]|uniref:Homeobox domain-containing protein n=1 Tax=Sclerotinia borealis (strain F-4128) TaxID=1432307 RepID=W9BZI6_SCLBF|nr:hypothetical protein SBOR_9622 [Sclerotinia borealis F-4128]
MTSSNTITDISKEQYPHLPRQNPRGAVSGRNSEMNFPTPEHSHRQNINPRDPYVTKVVSQRLRVFSDPDWRGLDLVSGGSRPRLTNVQESLPSIRTMFSGFESQEGPTEPEYRHNAKSFSPNTAERTYNTSPGSIERRRLSSDYYDEETQRQRDRYQPVGSGRSPMIATSGYDSAAATTISSTARRESLQSLSDFRAYSSHGSSYIPRPTREQSIPAIPEFRVPDQDNHTSKPPFHSPISEPSSVMYRPNLPSLTTPDRSYNRSYSQTPAGRSHSDYPSRSEYALEATRPYRQHNHATSHDKSYTSSQSDYGYQHPRNQSFSGPPCQLNQGKTPFTNGYHSGDYSLAAYQTQDMGDIKPRKRRGNLPKPITDVLTAWFINHLEHPYPNEEEKQLLMRQTGLQLNQISNWFINARRRKLPALQNSARAESAARSHLRHHNRMHSTDDGQSPMSLCDSEVGDMAWDQRIWDGQQQIPKSGFFTETNTKQVPPSSQSVMDTLESEFIEAPLRVYSTQKAIWCSKFSNSDLKISITTEIFKNSYCDKSRHRTSSYSTLCYLYVYLSLPARPVDEPQYYQWENQYVKARNSPTLGVRVSFNIMSSLCESAEPSLHETGTGQRSDMVGLGKLGTENQNS